MILEVRERNARTMTMLDRSGYDIGGLGDRKVEKARSITSIRNQKSSYFHEVDATTESAVTGSFVCKTHPTRERADTSLQIIE